MRITVQSIVRHLTGRSRAQHPTWTWADSPAYLAMVEAHLAPLAGGPLWARRWWEYTDIAHFDEFVRLLARYTQLRDTRLLDTGCGVAGFMLALRHTGAAELVGAELDPVRADLAMLRVRDEPRIRVLRGDVTALSSTEAAGFDVVTGLHVIEHVADPDAYVSTLRRLLGRGGLLLLACPNRLWPLEAHGGLPLVHWLPRRLRRRLALCLTTARFPLWLRQRADAALGYETDFTVGSLLRLLRRHRFTIIEANPSGAWGGPAYLAAGLDLLARWLPPVHRLVRAAVSAQIIVVARAA